MAGKVPSQDARADRDRESRMVSVDFLLDERVRQWLGGVQPAWTLLDIDSLQHLCVEPGHDRSAIRITADLSAEQLAGSAVVRNTGILLRQAIECGGLPLTTTGNLSRRTVAAMSDLLVWPDYDHAEVLRICKVVNEPDVFPLHVIRQLAQACGLVRGRRGKLVATRLGKSLLNDTEQGRLAAVLFHLTFWHTNLGYFDRGLLGSWPQQHIGIVLWSLSVCAGDWQTPQKITRLCSIPEPEALSSPVDHASLAIEYSVLRLLVWFGLMEMRTEELAGEQFRRERHYFRKTTLFDRLLAFDVKLDIAQGPRH
jgi:hypothetical protein